MNITDNLANYGDWRVPNTNELLSIVEYGIYHPAVNTTIW